MPTLSPSLEEVESHFRASLPNIPFPKRPVSASDILDELTLEHIASLLASCPELEVWSSKPRIYCLLRLLGYKGHEEIFLAFRDDEYCDFSVPFTAANLPQAVSSNPKLCASFLNLQPIVCTKPVFMSFDGSKAPFHRNTLHGELHFLDVWELDQSSLFKLDIVRNRHSGRDFTRKSIYRGTREGNRKPGVQAFRNEVLALQKVDHHHLLKCAGTYTDQTNYAMILEPAADHTLKSMLTVDEGLPVSGSDLQKLPQYFGCLAEVVAFLHAKGLRYNDLRPSNILVHGGRLLLCNFGTSHENARGTGFRMSGSIDPSCLAYSSPEVRMGIAGDEASDVWSLGRVYLEMLTVLSGKSVQDLDDFLYAEDSSIGTKDLPLPSISVRLLDWLQRINTSEGYSDIKGLISQMLDRDPENRPEAVSVFESIRKASPHFLCTSCAEVDVQQSLPGFSLNVEVDGHAEVGASVPASVSAPAPALSPSPDPRNLWSDVQHQRKRETSLSIQGPRPSFRGFDPVRFSGHSRNNSTASRRSDSLDYSMRSDPLTRHDSASITSQDWHIRDGEVLDLETTLLSYMIELGEATNKYKENGIGDGTLKLILYRTECAQAWKVTRRMVILDPDGETQITRIFSNWLPLADLKLNIYDDTVTMSWSDCDHDVQEPTRNYVETHSKKYDASKPNNKIVLKVASSATSTSNAIALVQALCSPLTSSPSGHDVSSSSAASTGTATATTPKQPDSQTRLLSGERVGVFRAHDDDQTDMMMIVGNLSQGATTKLYTLPRTLDLTIAMQIAASADPSESEELRQLFQAAVTGLLTTSYTSDAQHLSKMMHKRGRFRKAVQVPRKAVFTFAKDTALFAFLEAVMGWSLVFLARLKSLKEKRTLVHECGAADMLLWRRKAPVATSEEERQQGKSGDGGEIAMTFRLHREGVGEKWISGLLPRGKIITKADGVEASINIRRSSAGDVLDRHEMRAVSTKSNKATSNGKAPDPESTAKFKLVFNSAQDQAEFQSVISESVQSMAASATPSSSIRSKRESYQSSS